MDLIRTLSGPYKDLIRTWGSWLCFARLTSIGPLVPRDARGPEDPDPLRRQGLQGHQGVRGCPSLVLLPLLFPSYPLMLMYIDIDVDVVFIRS